MAHKEFFLFQTPSSSRSNSSSACKEAVNQSNISFCQTNWQCTVSSASINTEQANQRPVASSLSIPHSTIICGWWVEDSDELHGAAACVNDADELRAAADRVV